MARTGDLRTRTLAALVGLAAFALSAQAMARPVLEAELGQATIGLGQRTTYTLTIRGGQGGELSLPRFGDLIVHGPTKQSQSIFRFINGQQTLETAQSYTWQVEGPKDGVYLIGPGVLEVKGEKFSSNAVELTVDGDAQPRAQQPSSRRQATNPFAGTPFGGGSVDPFDALDAFGDLDEQIERWTGGARNTQSDVFLTAAVDKKSVFLGEQVTLSLYLMSRANITGVQTISFPKLDGFWAEDVESPTQLVPEPRVIDGVHYNAYLLRRRALFPLKSGKLVIEPVEAQINLGIGLFFGAQAETVKRRSRSVTLDIKPLPAEGQPPDFEAAHVGSWTLSASVPEGEVKLGQPVQLKVTVEGRGNVKNLRMPKPDLPVGLKTYDPTVTDKPRISGRRYGGSRVAEWVVVPERTGRFTIPPLEFRYFDPASGKYRTSRTQQVELEVGAGDVAQAPQVSAPGTVAVPTAANVLSGGIRPVRLEATLAAATAPAWARAWFWPVTAAPVTAWLLLLGGGWVMGALRARDPDQLKQRRARGVAGKRLKGASERLDANDATGFLAAVEKALLEFVTDRLGVAARGLTRDELRQALLAKKLPEASVTALVEVLESCETARFMPGATSPSAMRGLFDKAKSVIEALDDARGKGGA